MFKWVSNPLLIFVRCTAQRYEQLTYPCNIRAIPSVHLTAIGKTPSHGSPRGSVFEVKDPRWATKNGGVLAQGSINYKTLNYSWFHRDYWKNTQYENPYEPTSFFWWDGRDAIEFLVSLLRLFMRVYMISFLHLVRWCFDGLFSLVCLIICIRLFIPLQSLPQFLGFLVFRRCRSMTPSVCWRRTCQSLSIKWGKLLRTDAPVMCGFPRLGHQKKFQRITMHHVRWLGFKKREEWWLERWLSSRKNNLSIERNKLAKL